MIAEALVRQYLFPVIGLSGREIDRDGGRLRRRQA